MDHAPSPAQYPRPPKPQKDEKIMPEDAIASGIVRPDEVGRFLDAVRYSIEKRYHWMIWRCVQIWTPEP